MAKDGFITRDGEVIETLPETQFRVQLDPAGEAKEGEIITAYLKGKLKRYRITILPGDRVRVEIDPKYPEIGRISYRLKK